MAVKRCVIESAGRQIKVFRGRKTRGGYVPEEVMVGEVDDKRLREIADGCGECVIVVPRHKVILRSTRLPAVDRDELSGIIGLHLMRTIPYPVEDVICRYQVLEQNEDGHSRVLAVIVPMETVRPYLERARGLGIKTKNLMVTLSSFGIGAWWAKAAVVRNAAVIDLDLNHGEICFCGGGKLFFSRHFPFGRENLARDNMDQMVEDIRVSLAVYEKQSLGPLPEELVVLLPFHEGTVLKEKLENSLRIPVKIAGTGDGLPTAPKTVQEAFHKNGQYSFTAGAGLFGSKPEDLLNLAPGEVEQEKKNKALRRQAATFIGLMLAAGIIGLCGATMEIQRKTGKRNALEAQSRQYHVLAREARKKIAFVNRLDKELQGRPFIPEIFEILRQLTPQEASLRLLSLDNQGRLTLQGFARDNSQVNQIQSGLVHSSNMRNVDLKFATSRQTANRSRTDFKIIAELTRAGENVP